MPRKLNINAESWGSRILCVNRPSVTPDDAISDSEAQADAA